MITLSKNTVEEWLVDHEAFCNAFMKYTFAWHHAVGADIELLKDIIEEAHLEWVGMVREWETKKFRQETESLSYIKIFAILLCVLSKRTYVGEMKQYECFRKPAPEFNGTPAQKAEYLSDLLGAPEAVSALQFCVSVLNFYEAKRIDRKMPFEFRMTASGRHDLLVMLTAKQPEPIAVYLSLEGFYARD